LTATLGRRFGVVSGIDVSPTLVELVRARHPLLDVHAADVRHLPFPDGTFDAVCSDSTLDHFDSAADIADALAEIRRALRRGGALLVTLDNGMNPLVAVRNAMPERWRQASRLVPYAVGATCRRPRDLRALLERSGFEVTRTGAILHCPRVLAVMAGNAVDRHGSERAREAYTRTLVAFERLSRLPTRFVTGHFLAALAIKR
jgi:ubiquinone/menaquinone biosynthesis C-methylase UbiE